MSDIFSGLVQGFLPQAQQIIARNDQQTAAQVKREQEILETLAKSENREIAARAMDGLMQIASGKRSSKGGILGKLFSAPPEELEHFQQIMQIADQFDQQMREHKQEQEGLQNLPVSAEKVSAPKNPMGPVPEPGPDADMLGNDMGGLLSQPPSAAMAPMDLVSGKQTPTGPPPLSSKQDPMQAPKGPGGFLGRALEYEQAGIPINSFGIPTEAHQQYRQNENIMKRQDQMADRQDIRDTRKENARNERHRIDTGLRQERMNRIDATMQARLENDRARIANALQMHAKSVNQRDEASIRSSQTALTKEFAQLEQEIESEYDARTGSLRKAAAKYDSGIDPTELYEGEQKYRAAKERRLRALEAAKAQLGSSSLRTPTPPKGGGKVEQIVPKDALSDNDYSIRVKPTTK